MNELEKLIALSKVVAKPWVIATWVLAILLALSVAGNVYLMLNAPEVTGVGAVCPNAGIINGLGINSLNGYNYGCGCNGLA